MGGRLPPFAVTSRNKGFSFPAPPTIDMSGNCVRGYCITRPIKPRRNPPGCTRKSANFRPKKSQKYVGLVWMSGLGGAACNDATQWNTPHTLTHHLSSFSSVSGLELLSCALACMASSYFENTNSNWACVPCSKKVHVFMDAMIYV